MSSVTEWMRTLLCPLEDLKDHFRTWGFTIYRTCFKPSSDQQWQDLLQKIQTHAYENALEMTGATEDDPGFQEIWSLFRIDARSDTALDGLDIDQLRQRYNNDDGGVPMNKDHRSHRVFLVADDEALSSVDSATTTVKCVDADYRAEDHIARNWRVGAQRYFGWMPMLASCVAELWVELGFLPFQKICPETIGGSHLVVWDALNL
ncbi:hypothetical protein E8E13_002558 [Curvularia kusanoi]|uniref:Uncharacterized protein n=1 Tax=Curvularia kusanoi TaxID=90978 RepID=A0A9P4W2T2_CURKU|nr:hypothetical protein E8E13_002558 [Curvularia kusanoi]